MAKAFAIAPASYCLGVDLGTTYTAAAVGRGSQTQVVPLSDRSPQMPSVVFRAPDGALVFGEAAARHTVTDPEFVASEFKRRLIDKRSFHLGEARVSAAQLSKSLLTWVVESVSAGEGGPPSVLTVAFPASWGPRSREVMNVVADVGGGTRMGLCTEPEAAAYHFASSGRVAPGESVAIYDFGGGTLDVAVMRREDDGRFEVLGEPTGLDHLGGLNFDSQLLNHVWSNLGWDDVDVDDPEMLGGLARLRRDCVEAKEALSSDTEVKIPVTLGTHSTVIRVTRSEFEDLIVDDVAESVRWLESTITAAGLTPEELNAVVLVGGSARVPLVSQLVTQQLNRPVAVSSQPKLCVAMGAALIGAATFASDGAEAPRPSPPAARDLAVTTDPSTTEVATGQLREPSDAPGPVNQIVELRVIETPPGAAPQVRAKPSAYRWSSVGLAALAVLLAGFVHQNPQVPQLRWDGNYVARLDPALRDTERLQPTFLGVAPLAPVRARTGQVDLAGSYQTLLLAGPVKAEALQGATSTPVLLVPPDHSTGKRLLTVPGVLLILGALFSAAYLKSLLDSVRRRGARIRPDELAGTVVGLAGVGVVIGLVLMLASWIFLARLPSVGGCALAVIAASAATGLLAFGRQEGPRP